MSHPDDDSEATRLARGRPGHVGGKLILRLDVPCSEELHDAVVALAAVSGLTKAEMARMLLERALFGELSMVRTLAAPVLSGRWDNGGRTEG